MDASARYIGLATGLKEAFERVVQGEIWMTFSQDKTQGRS